MSFDYSWGSSCECDDCLVVFYESFKTNYSYTKIGHIDNLPDLSGEEVTIQFMSNL